MYRLIRPLIFLLKPEQAHTITVTLLRLAGSLAPTRALLLAIYRPRTQGPEVKTFGLTFSNPIGMAAGYDKNGLGWRGLACLGFSHIELGTVTPRPQPGNPKPRLFRLEGEQAVINRMGFPNRGAEYLVNRLGGSRPEGLILGVNIGKNLDTSLEEAVQDYLILVRIFSPLVDYLAVNVSSPNTPGLRKLQTRQMLGNLLTLLASERQIQAEHLSRRVPILVKLSPDLNDVELDDALEVALNTGMDGVIISNTTVSRKSLDSPLFAEIGGLSGTPLTELNTNQVRKVYRRTAGRLPIIASGGIMNPADAQAKLDAGAVLVQLYTGLIFEGPELVKNIINSRLQTNKKSFE